MDRQQSDQERDADALTVHLDQVAVAAGQPLRGALELRLGRAATVRRLWVEAAGRELVATPPRYRPVIYWQPPPFITERTRTGAVKLAYREHQELSRAEAAPLALPAGRHWFPFVVTPPAATPPSFGGALAKVEHEVSAGCDLGLRRRPLTGWAPLHVWAALDQPPRGDAVRLTAPAPDHTIVGRLTARWQAPVTLVADLPSNAIALGREQRLAVELANPERLPLRHLYVELWAHEESRHQAATDTSDYLVGRWQRPLDARRRWQGELAWSTVGRVGPTLRGARFRLDWQLVVGVTLPWRLGPRAEAAITLFDPGSPVAPRAAEPTQLR